MKPPPLDILSPSSLIEALALLSEHGDAARPLAGGQSLVPLLNFRLSRPEILIDLNRISDLAFIKDGGDHIAIGAMTRERTIEENELVRDQAPLLQEATTQIAHLPIRSRGTIGGSLANADPAAEYPAVALALEIELVTQSVRGERRIKAAAFFEDVLTTALEPDELLTEIIVPKAPPGSSSAFVEIARRHGDFALAGVAAQITFANNAPADVCLAVCGAGSTASRLTTAEEIILQDGVGVEAVKAASAAAAASVDPMSDLHASADYRRRLVGVMTTRALEKVVQRAAVTS
ncbi:MAG: xanthine dehydrogenase family protein subunit M [Alphaproteobacteria bacterium]|nr:xanthine dehydrogenase family protein subunit M [Alphaproteobacteria bacterium]